MSIPSGQSHRSHSQADKPPLPSEVSDRALTLEDFRHVQPGTELTLYHVNLGLEDEPVWQMEWLHLGTTSDGRLTGCRGGERPVDCLEEGRPKGHPNGPYWSKSGAYLGVIYDDGLLYMGSSESTVFGTKKAAVKAHRSAIMQRWADEDSREED